MRSSVIFFATLALVLAASNEPGFAAEANAASLPRYKFVPGTKLEYQSTSTNTFHEADDKDKKEVVDEDESRFTLWVLKTNEDKSWRCVMREFVPDKRGRDFETSRLSYFDIDNTGHLISNDKYSYISTIELLPPLPKNPAEMKQGWNLIHEKNDFEGSYASQSAKEPKSWALTSDWKRSYFPVYGFQVKSTFELDTTRGLIASISRQEKQEWSRKGETETKVQLRSIEKGDAAECEKMLADIVHYFPAQEKAMRLDRSIVRLKTCEETLKEINDLLNDAKNKIQSAAFKENIERDIYLRKFLDKYARERAKDLENTIDHAIPAWELKDLDGRTHKSTDYAGKIVVFDIWKRSCGYCIQSVPKLNKLAKHYEGKPVAIVGLNFDEDETNAKFVAEKIKFDYPNLLATETEDKQFMVRGMPSFFVVDRKGIVRHIQIGGHSDLYESMVKEIDGLLKN